MNVAVTHHATATYSNVLSSLAFAPAIATTAHAVAAPANSRIAVRRKSPKRTQHLHEGLRSFHHQIRVAYLGRAFVRCDPDRHIGHRESVEIGDVVAGIEAREAVAQLLHGHPLVDLHARPDLEHLATPVRDEAL